MSDLDRVVYVIIHRSRCYGSPMRGHPL